MYNPNIHHRRSIRLQHYDYSQNGAYFITMCIYNRERLLCEIKKGKVILSEIGKIVKNNWEEIPQHFKNIQLDEFIIMPDHVHGILIINNVDEVGVQSQSVGIQYIESQQNKFQHIIPKSIGSIIRSYKSSVTNNCRKNGFTNFKWQRNYYEHIIRSETAKYKIQEYIINNPLNWEKDETNFN